MPRTRSLATFERIVDGAGSVFARVGYRRAMMSDIAEAAGVALGTLYGYAETKEELFELALRRGLGEPGPAVWDASRGADGFARSTFQFVRGRLRDEEHFPLLRAAAGRATPADATAELEAVAGELYDVIDRFHVAIRMLDRSTPHWPELATVFAEELRAPIVDRLTRYLARRAGEGALRTPADVPATARLVLETCATHAMHRRYSPGGSWTDDATARHTALEFIVAGLEPPAVRV